MAVPAVFADYNRQFEGDAALQKKIGAAEDWRINVVGVRLAASGRTRQPGRGDGHLRQGRAPDRPQPARRRRRGTSPASSSSTSPRCWPRSATGSRTRSASSSRPTGPTPRSTPPRREPSHEGDCAWLARAWLRGAAAAPRSRSAEPADPRLREVVYDPQAVVTVPVKRGVVTLVVLDADEAITESRPAWAATAPSPKPPGASRRSPAAATSSSSPRARPARRTTWPSSPTGARTPSASSCSPMAIRSRRSTGCGQGAGPRRRCAGRRAMRDAGAARSRCRRCRRRRRRSRSSPSACRPSRR